MSCVFYIIASALRIYTLYPASTVLHAATPPRTRRPPPRARTRLLTERAQREISGAVSRPRDDIPQRSQRMTIAPHSQSVIATIQGLGGVFGRHETSRQQTHREGNGAASAGDRPRVRTLCFFVYFSHDIIGCSRRIRFGLGLCQSVSYIKPIPTPTKTYLLRGKKSGPKRHFLTSFFLRFGPLFNLIFLGVGLTFGWGDVGFIIFTSTRFPTEQNLVNRKTPYDRK